MILLNNKPINITMFPDNTSQVWKLDESLLKPGTLIEVKWKFSHESEFLHLAQLKDLLDHNEMRAVLEIDYLPYGRQDKVVENGKTFALVTFSKLLNSLRFDAVTIFDPHSNRSEYLIDKSRFTYPGQQILDIRVKVKSEILCFPDYGALEKYKKLFRNLSYVFGEKSRDQLTGNITDYEVIGGVIGKNVLIVDDICDGGATFVLLAKELIKKGAKEVNLFVSHGIFSKGTRILFDAGIKRIFTKEGEIFQREGTTQC